MITTADIDFTCKYAAMRCVLAHASLPLQTLLKSCPSHCPIEHQSVDIKVQDLVPDEYTCIPGWHIDTINDSEAVHHIWVSGLNRTEFLRDEGVWVVPNETWHTYRRDLHRGPRVKLAEKRILIRVTESHKVRANNRLNWRS